MLQRILDRVIEEATKAGKLGPRVDTSYTITFPEIDSGEHNVLAQGMNWLLPALQTAKNQGWISDETAMRIMFEFCGEEIDIHEERERIARQAGSTKPTLPDQQTQDRQDAEEKPANPNITGNGVRTHSQISYDGLSGEKG